MALGRVAGEWCGAGKQKGPARGDERGPGSLAETGDHSDGDPEGVDRNLVRRLWRRRSRCTNAKREGRVCARCRGPKARYAWVCRCCPGLLRSEATSPRKKKGLDPKIEPTESGANGRGRRKRHLPMDSTEGGGFGLIRVWLCGTEGGGFGQASRRQAQYVPDQCFQQSGRLHVCHALRAQMGQFC